MVVMSSDPNLLPRDLEPLGCSVWFHLLQALLGLSRLKGHYLDRTEVMVIKSCLDQVVLDESTKPSGSIHAQQFPSRVEGGQQSCAKSKQMYCKVSRFSS